MKKHEQGFITLFFILGISFTFLTWITLSSERVFEYIRIKEVFATNRSVLHNHILCADAFINIMLESRFNLTFIDNRYWFRRKLYFSDDFLCEIESIGSEYQGNAISKIFFTIGDFRFEYGFKNGFIDSIKSFNLF